MTGIVNSTGARSGVIGTTVGTPASADLQKDSWRLGRSDYNHYTSDYVLGWNIVQYLGSNITHNSGVITVTTAGLYLCYFSIANYNNEVNDHSWRFRVNGTAVDGTRMYQNYRNFTSDVGIKYDANQNMVLLIVPASATIDVYGNGYTHGEAASTTFTHFTGVRIGAKT